MCTYGLNCFKILWLVNEKINNVINCLGADWREQRDQWMSHVHCWWDKNRGMTEFFLSVDLWSLFIMQGLPWLREDFRGPFSSEWTQSISIHYWIKLSKKAKIPCCSWVIGTFILEFCKPEILSKCFCLILCWSARWSNSIQPPLVDCHWPCSAVMFKRFHNWSISAWSCFSCATTMVFFSLKAWRYH